MKTFKQFSETVIINEKKYYLEVDNRFDAYKDALSSEAAIKALYPKAKKISWVGVDDPNGYDVSIYDVLDEKGEHHTVHVSEK